MVALTIPLVLAATFLFMRLGDIGLHKISLGALILSLGLLVDDAIIAVEMMATKMEQGWDRLRAASFAYTSTAMPMLSGTLVTVAGFLPIATAASATGEYTRSIFQVTAIALAVSWVAAVVFVPYLGYKLLPDLAHGAAKPSWFRRLLRRARARPRRAPRARRRRHLPHARSTTACARVIHWCVAHRTTVLVATVALFAASLARVPLRAAAVLPRFQPAGAARRPAPRRRARRSRRPKAWSSASSSCSSRKRGSRAT